MIVYEHNESGISINIRYQKDDYVLQAGELSISGEKIPSDTSTLNDPSKEIDIAKEKKTEEVEEEKRKALADEIVTVDGVEVWNRTTKTWETKNGVNVIIDGNSLPQLNKFALKLAKNSAHEKANWKNNGDKIKLNETSYDLISDAMETEDDKIFDWVSDRYDEINDATTQAEIELIDTTYS